MTGVASLAQLAGRGTLEIGDGYRTKTDELGRPGLPILRVAEVKQGRLTPALSDYVREEYRQSIGSKVSRAFDVVVTTKGTVGRVARIPAGAPEFVYSPQVCFIRVTDDSIDPRWLYYWFVGPSFREQSLRVQAQTDMAAYINLADLRAMQINVPVLAQQRGIATTLGALDDRIESNRRVVTAAFGIADLEARQMASERRPEPYAATMDLIMGSAFKGTHFSESGRGRPLMRIRDLKTFSPKTWTTESRPDETTIHPGEIVVGMDAEFRARIWMGPDALLNQRVCSFRARPGVSRAFVLHALAPQLHASERAKSGTTVIHLNRADIERFTAPTVTPGEHRQLSYRTEPLVDAAVNAATQSRRLSAIRDALLPELMSGRIRVPEAREAVEAATSD